MILDTIVNEYSGEGPNKEGTNRVALLQIFSGLSQRDTDRESPRGPHPVSPVELQAESVLL